MKKQLKRLLRLSLGLILLKFVQKVVQAVKKYSDFKRLQRSLPTPSRVNKPLFGFIPQLIKNAHKVIHFRVELFDEVEKETGKRHDCIILPTPVWFPVNMVMNRDPEITKFILKDEFDSFDKTSLMKDVASDLFGKDGMMVLRHGSQIPEEKAAWSYQRKIAAKVFSRKAFSGHVHKVLLKHIRKVSTILHSALREEKSAVIEFKKLLYSFTLDTIGEIGLGVDLKSLESEEEVEYGKALDSFTSLMVTRIYKPFWKTLGFLYASEKELKRSMNVVNDFAKKVIKQKREEKRSGKGDILSLFLETDEKVTDDQLRNIAVAFFFAGRDSTAGLLSFAMYLLATHENIQQELCKEIQQAYPKESDIPDLMSLKELRLLDAVVFETLRLFPAAPMNIRQAMKDVTLPNGVELKKGTIISYEIGVMGRNEKTYEDPGSFKPERWMGKERDVGSFDQYQFPVFQAGPRMCPGKNLSLFEAKLFLVQFLRSFKVKMPLSAQPQNRELFEKDVAILNGKSIYRSAITVYHYEDLNLEISRR